jgi:hypothetical protein
MRALSLLFVVLFFCACQKTPPPTESTAIELHTYDVPKGTIRPLLTTFKDGFWVDEKTPPVGRATITPDGRLMVVAPANMQVGVQALVDEITKHPPASADFTTEIHYWIVVGHPGSASPPLSPALKEVQPALDEIARVEGPQTFTLTQHVKLSSVQDEWGKAEAAPGDSPNSKIVISQLAVQSTDGVFAKIEIHYGKNDGIETRVNLASGQTVVLGATGQRVGDAPDAGDSATLYYLVRVAPRADGQHP